MSSPTARIFVTGTDTDIGKTFVSALLVKCWGLNYWKPIQTGLSEDPGDTATVNRLLESSGGIPKASTIFEPACTYLKPLSPWRCTVLENREEIKLDNFKLPVINENNSSTGIIIEGAGGLLVPISKNIFTTNLIKHLNASVILVASSELGTLNHTLMSMEILKQNDIPVIGIILNGNINEDNAQTLSELGIKIIAQIPKAKNLEDVVPCIPKFEELFK
ncbi:dethiobiotin synthase [Martiniozyma asiatica (nom. inval.)]|nr:dethiobiotin synthase [Martiniozyma asiatica]